MPSQIIYYIYMIKNTCNAKVYIGKSKDPHKRFTQHLLKSRNDCLNFKSALYSAMKSHGVENFYMEIIADAARKIKRDRSYVKNRIHKGSEGWRYITLPFQNDPDYDKIKPSTSHQ